MLNQRKQVDEFGLWNKFESHSLDLPLIVGWYL